MLLKEPEFKKFYAYARLLLSKLVRRDLSESIKPTDEVAMDYFRLQKIKDGAIDLISGEAAALDGLSEAGIMRTKEGKTHLSEIIDVLNDRFGTEFEEADRLFFEQIERMDQNRKIFEKILGDQIFGGLVKELMMKKIYARLNEDAK